MCGIIAVLRRKSRRSSPAAAVVEQAVAHAVRTLHALLLGGGICARHVQFQWNRKVTHPPYTHPHPE